MTAGLMTGNRGKPGRFYVQRAAYERKMIEDSIRANGTHAAAARWLGLQRPYMLRLMLQLGMSKQHLRGSA